MAQGSGSATADRAFALGLTLLCLLVCSGVADASVYTVGDGKGWTFGLTGWPNGKKFRAGDVLVFKYNPALHNVVAVSAAGYGSCTESKGSKVFQSGNDRITLGKGTSHFICSVPGHCAAGMKIAVTAV